MDWLATAAQTRPAAPAILLGDRVVSYEELDRAADGVAEIVRASEAYASGPVAFWGERSLDAIAAAWGIPRAGVSAVAVDPHLDPVVAMEATRAAGVRGLWAPPDGGFDGLVERGRSVTDLPGPPIGDRYVVLTSGSAGRPKGVRLTTGNLEAAVAASRRRLGNGSDDPWLCVLPLFHVGGLSILWRQAEAGAPVVLVEHFDRDAVVVALDSVRYASLVPVMLRRVLAVERRWTGLEAVLVGGAAADERLLTQARAAGIPAVPTYGMTETCSQIATPAVGEDLDGTVGRPLEGAEIRVVDAARNPVVESPGRIEVWGPMVSPGYVGETDRRPDEWFVTGDEGRLRGDGRLQVLGRADRVIVTGGENVHPEAVERLLLRNPAIGAVFVHGVPDDEWGMRVVADVVTDSALGSLEEWATRHLPPPMRPREWRLVDAITSKLDGATPAEHT